jgi:hypothetical protein
VLSNPRWKQKRPEREARGLRYRILDLIIIPTIVFDIINWNEYFIVRLHNMGVKDKYI